MNNTTQNTKGRDMTSNHGFYGFDWGTYYVTQSGRKWLIQSDDRDDLPLEVDDLPDGGQWLDHAVCADMDLAGVED